MEFLSVPRSLMAIGLSAGLILSGCNSQDKFERMNAYGVDLEAQDRDQCLTTEELEFKHQLQYDQWNEKARMGTETYIVWDHLAENEVAILTADSAGECLHNDEVALREYLGIK